VSEHIGTTRKYQARGTLYVDPQGELLSASVTEVRVQRGAGHRHFVTVLLLQCDALEERTLAICNRLPVPTRARKERHCAWRAAERDVEVLDTATGCVLVGESFIRERVRLE